MEDVPRGVHVNFLKAERSLHRWALEDIRRIHVAEEQAVEEGGGVEMHVLEDAGHWVGCFFPTHFFLLYVYILLVLKTQSVFILKCASELEADNLSFFLPFKS